MHSPSWTDRGRSRIRTRDTPGIRSSSPILNTHPQDFNQKEARGRGRQSLSLFFLTFNHLATDTYSYTIHRALLDLFRLDSPTKPTHTTASRKRLALSDIDIHSPPSDPTTQLSQQRCRLGTPSTLALPAANPPIRLPAQVRVTVIPAKTRASVSIINRLPRPPLLASSVHCITTRKQSPSLGPDSWFRAKQGLTILATNNTHKHHIRHGVSAHQAGPHRRVSEHLIPTYKMFFSSSTPTITPAMTSVAMSRSDSRDSTTSNSCYNYTSYAPNTAYSALLSASPTSSWPSSQGLVRSDSNASTTTSQPSSVAMRRDSSNSSWMPSPYRSCMSSFGAEASSYLSDDDLLCTPESLPIETIPAVTPKKELTTEEQIAFLRDLQEKEAAHQQQAESRRKTVRFAGPGEEKARRPSTLKRRQTNVRRGLSSLNGPQ